MSLGKVGDPYFLNGPLACPFDGRQLIAGVIDSAWRGVDLAEVVDGKAAQVAATARADSRAVVTENAADFTAERDIVLGFVLKRILPAGGAQAPALAAVLDRWNHEHPDPYLGPHWPRVD